MTNDDETNDGEANDREANDREANDREPQLRDALDLDAWAPVEPPDDFADRVMRAAEGGDEHPHEVAPVRAERSRWRTPGLLAVGMGLAAAAAGLFVWTTGEPASAGSLSAARRTEVSIGTRAVAVAEAGAELSWVAGDDTVVEQPEGNVFYRVDRGGPFVVRTPHGTVAVRGTCFRVEVMDMNAGWSGREARLTKQSIGSAVVAAALTAGVVITVYEGRVAVANEHGREDLDAGERSHLEAGRPPSPAEDALEASAVAAAGRHDPLDDEAIAALDIDALRAEHRALAAAHAARLEELQRLEAQLNEIEGASVDDRDHFYPATNEDLTRWAEACELRLDEPPVLGVEPGEVQDETAEKLGMTAAEREALDDAIRRVHQRYTRELSAIYIEATGDTHGVGTLSPYAMLAEIQDKAGPGEEQIYVRIARERAGLERVPTDVSGASPTERAVRLYSSLGDELQRTLAQSVGPERAHELRATDGGWPWGHSRFRRNCNDGE